MAKYISIENDITEVIDDSFCNIAFIRKQRFYFPKMSGGDILNYTKFVVDISGIDQPLVAFSCICPTTFYLMSPTTVVLNVSGAVQDNVPNSKDKLNNSANFVDVFLFGRPTDNTANVGMKVWDESGRLVFDANHRYMRPVSMINKNENYSPVAGGTRQFNKNEIINLPTGRNYAVIPLNRVFAIYAEYLSDGYEYYWMADIYCSSCAIDGSTLYLTSSLVDKVEDTSVNSVGVCRHQYLVVDVTGY